MFVFREAPCRLTLWPHVAGVPTRRRPRATTHGGERLAASSEPTASDLKNNTAGRRATAGGTRVQALQRALSSRNAPSRVHEVRARGWRSWYRGSFRLRGGTVSSSPGFARS